jgi:arsenate reductase
MKKIYHLKTCDTCRKILKNCNLAGVELQNIKETPVTEKQLEEMHTLTGSYEALLNKRARIYKEMGLKDQILTENACKELILAEYTFLKRPVAILDKVIFVGNSKKVVEAMQRALK